VPAHAQFLSEIDDIEIGPVTGGEHAANAARNAAEFLCAQADPGLRAGLRLKIAACSPPVNRADLNIIDFDKLGMRRHEVVYDLPAGGRRLMQRADGYRHTFVAGTETLCDDQHTGAMPGQLLR